MTSYTAANRLTERAPRYLVAKSAGRQIPRAGVKTAGCNNSLQPGPKGWLPDSIMLEGLAAKSAQQAARYRAARTAQLPNLASGLLGERQ